jgi:heme/copper-type cytochrome/quinol oxidase subunit 4
VAQKCNVLCKLTSVQYIQLLVELLHLTMCIHDEASDMSYLIFTADVALQQVLASLTMFHNDDAVACLL